MGRKSGNVYSEADKQRVYELHKRGVTRRQIASMTGLYYGTVVRWLQGLEIERKSSGGVNADRHLCRSCCYRGKRSLNGCDFIWVTGKMRGCKVEDCDRYKRGKAIIKKIGEGL